MAHSPFGTCVFVSFLRPDWGVAVAVAATKWTVLWTGFKPSLLAHGKKVFLDGASLSASRGFSAKRHLFTAFRFQLRYKLSLMLESCFRNRRAEDSALPARR